MVNWNNFYNRLENLRHKIEHDVEKKLYNMPKFERNLSNANYTQKAGVRTWTGFDSYTFI